MKVFLVLAALFAAPAASTVSSSAFASETLRSTMENAEPTQVHVSVALDSAMTAGLVPTVMKFTSPIQSLNAIESTLAPLYGNVEEGFASFRVLVDGMKLPGIAADRFQLYTGFFAESELFGSVHNPVIPELDANFAVLGGVRLGAKFREPHSQILIEAELAGGLGTTRSIRAAGTDFIDTVSVLSSNLWVIAPSIRVSRPIDLGHRLMLEPTGFVRYSYWNTSAPDFNPAWRWQAGLDLTCRAPWEIALETRFGPQPLPISVLPLVWDGNHGTFNEASALTFLGAGARLEHRFAGGWNLLGRLGFFGGYPGAQLHLGWKYLALELATWGLEESTNFRGIEGRIYSLGLELRI